MVSTRRSVEALWSHSRRNQKLIPLTRVDLPNHLEKTLVMGKHSTSSRKVVCKSRGLCDFFQLFGVASIQVLLLFEGGLYAMS